MTGGHVQEATGERKKEEADWINCFLFCFGVLFFFLVVFFLGGGGVCTTYGILWEYCKCVYMILSPFCDEVLSL